MVKARFGSKRGNAMVEFAISFPFLILILAGIFQFGYSFFVYNGLKSAVQNGARFGAVTDYEAGSDGFSAKIKNVVVYGTPAPKPDAKAVLPGLSTDSVAVTASEFDGTGIPRLVTVAISSYEVPSIWRSIRFEDKPRATFAYMGQFIDE
jgi:hypothetical protein